MRLYIMRIKRMFIATLLISVSSMLSAQLTYGTTGLLHAPSAEMQKDKTVMLGGNFMNKEITPPTWYYHTYNYYLNVTIMPWLNQDRYFSIRLRALKEGQFWRYMPAIVFGTSDPFTSSGGGSIGSTEGNGYYSRFYAAATKYIAI